MEGQKQPFRIFSMNGLIRDLSINGNVSRRNQAIYLFFFLTPAFLAIVVDDWRLPGFPETYRRITGLTTVLLGIIITRRVYKLQSQTDQSGLLGICIPMAFVIRARFTVFFMLPVFVIFTVLPDWIIDDRQVAIRIVTYTLNVLSILWILVALPRSLKRLFEEWETPNNPRDGLNLWA